MGRDAARAPGLPGAPAALPSSRRLGLRPLLLGLASGANPCAQDDYPLGIASERPGDHPVRPAARTSLGFLTRVDLGGQPGKLGFHGGDYTRRRVGKAHARIIATDKPRSARHRGVGRITERERERRVERLEVGEASIDPVLARHQIVVGAHLRDAPVVDHHDAVRRASRWPGDAR